MKSFNYKFYIRKAHRYLGFFIGVQFLLWTLGGFYFSWTDIDEIHGDHLMSHKHSLQIPAEMISPSMAIERVKQRFATADVVGMTVVEVLGQYFYAIECLADGRHFTVLAGLKDGALRPAISESEARTIAQNATADVGDVKEMTYLISENMGKHHEYREKPLPAWAATFKREGINVYVSAETGQVTSVRTDSWRVFDFLWMLHTMDYNSRDDFNNYLLRAFSVLGITTVLSGFTLFFVSSRFFRRLVWRRNRTS